jgi:hypothetical protein
MIRIQHQKEPLKFPKWRGENDQFMLTLLSPHRKTFISITNCSGSPRCELTTNKHDRKKR